MPIKLMAVSRRRPGLTRAEYFQRMERYFGGMASAKDSKIALCVQSQVMDGAFGTVSDSYRQQMPERDGVIEIYFDNFQDLMISLDPKNQPEVSQDVQSFSDESTNIMMLAEDEEIPVPNPRGSFPGKSGFVHGSGGFKVLQYIMRDGDVFPGDFYRRWREAHLSVFEKASYARERMRRVVASKRSRFSDNEDAARKHRGLAELPVYDLAVSMWFDTVEDAGAFRQYNEVLQGSSTKFADWSKTFFLYTRSVPILLREARA